MAVGHLTRRTKERRETPAASKPATTRCRALQGGDHEIWNHRSSAVATLGGAAGEMSKHIKAQIFTWGRMPGVDYTFANGDREAHPIGMEDWPILWQLERAGKLTFQNDDIRERFQLMKPTSDDPS